MTLEEAAQKIAPLMAQAAQTYSATEDLHLRKFLLNAINGMCRQMEHFCPPRVSRAAALKAGKHDLRTWSWKTQPKHDPGRRNFHLEHVVPVAEMRRRILANPSVENCQNTLAQAEIAWILKDEDKELTRLGYASKRLDPKQAYTAARIELL